MPDIKPPVLVFLVDAFRHDFLGEDVTPNLAELANRSPATAQADPRLQRFHPLDRLHGPSPRRDRLLDGVLLPSRHEPLERPVAPSTRGQAAE